MAPPSHIKYAWHGDTSHQAVVPALTRGEQPGTTYFGEMNMIFCVHMSSAPVFTAKGPSVTSLSGAKVSIKHCIQILSVGMTWRALLIWASCQKVVCDHSTNTPLQVSLPRISPSNTNTTKPQTLWGNASAWCSPRWAGLGFPRAWQRLLMVC